MRRETRNHVLALQPVPRTIVSVRDREGRNNALVVGFAANVSLDPAMVMVGIVPSRFSHHMVKENPCFVPNRAPGRDSPPSLLTELTVSIAPELSDFLKARDFPQILLICGELWAIIFFRSY